MIYRRIWIQVSHQDDWKHEYNWVPSSGQCYTNCEFPYSPLVYIVALHIRVLLLTDPYKETLDIPDVGLSFGLKLVGWVLDDVPVEREAVIKHLKLVKDLGFQLVMLQLDKHWKLLHSKSCQIKINIEKFLNYFFSSK